MVALPRGATRSASKLRLQEFSCVGKASIEFTIAFGIKRCLQKFKRLNPCCPMAVEFASVSQPTLVSLKNEGHCFLKHLKLTIPLPNLFFNMTSMISAPWASCKGSDSMILLEWLVFLLKLNIRNPAVRGHEQLLRNMLQVCGSCLGLKMVHTHGLWLERPSAKQLYVHIMTILRGYTMLGRAALQLHMQAFIQKPKQHALHHIGCQLKKQLLVGATLITNPQRNACEINEDYMGRISRLSRRVGFRLCNLRVCQRYFLKVVALLRKRVSGKPKVAKRPRGRLGVRK